MPDTPRGIRFGDAVGPLTIDGIRYERPAPKVDLKRLRDQVERTLAEADARLRPRYRSVAASSIRQDVRRWAEWAVDVASENLDVPRPWCRFFRPLTEAERQGLDGEFKEVDVGGGEAWGMTVPLGDNEIWVAATLEPMQAAEICAHEVRHRWQVLAGTKEQREEDAKRYARWFMDYYVHPYVGERR